MLHVVCETHALNKGLLERKSIKGLKMVKGAGNGKASRLSRPSRPD